MRILLSIDDTDNLESRGTGELASLIAEDLELFGWGRSRHVTRHQLLLHPDIPYTSHNSAMCFEAEIDEEALEPLIRHAGAFLQRESAPGSDPGLCVAVVDRVAGVEMLHFGERAKETVLTKEEAYALAARLGVHLSEHGGTGQGVVGALAGAGLRLGGNDGRMKGSLDIAGVMSVADLLGVPGVDAIQGMEGETVAPEDLVRVADKPKTVMVGGRSVLMVAPAQPEDGVRWQTLHRRELRRF
ncbi:hypothetical protein [Geomesophilobacter sediminis]|uniref:Uncharacterized protein n=1 Tax=Geomesophilobacter sediminis TaxID=2798584 RepID=A0A8J7J7L3_9BACT|nr:hypothetical protein [Geomesophilobacter sediminis]MBJ6725291.1 hypothetical protein [Geomesophilobacter sediminis]